MTKLIILRGLPASGKSTWARSWCEDPANTWPHCVISLDDIRLMIAGSAQVRNRLQSEHGKRFNDMVVAMGRHMIADALDAGWDVVADAQHANPRYAAELALLAQRHGALWETRDFDVPLDELLRRNAARDTADRVPEDYIRSSWKHFHTAMFRPLEPGDPNGNLLERMRAISLQRHFVNIGGRIAPSMREGFYRRQRSGGATRVREVLCCGRDGGDIVRPSRQSRSRTSRVVARAR